MIFVQRRSWWLLTLLLLIGFASRVHHLGAQSLWFDEAWSAYAAQRPTLLDAANADSTNPPFYYILLHLAGQSFGTTEFSLRLFSTFCALLTIALAYRLGARLFNRKAGTFAALLVTASPLIWWASQEARMYTLLSTLILICALAWHTLQQQPTLKWYAVLWLAELALLYSHNTGLIAVLWLNVVTIVAWLVARRPKRPFNYRIWFAGQLGVGLLWVPYLTRFLTLGEANAALANTTPPTPENLARVWQALWVVPWERVLRGETWLQLAALVGLALTLLVFIPWRKAKARWLLLHTFLLTALLIAGLLVLRNELHGRYLVMIAPLLLIVMGAGIARLPSTASRWAAALAAFILLIFNVNAASQTINQHDDAWGMVQHYKETLTANDTVLAWSYADRYDLAYYWDRLGVSARRVTLPEGASLETVFPLLSTSGDIALNVWYTQRADYRGMMTCLLSDGAGNLPETYTVNGMTSLLYRSPTLRPVNWQPTSIAFGQLSTPIARLSAVGDLPRYSADRAWCLPLQIDLLQNISAPLKATVLIYDSADHLLTQTDAIFATAAGQTSDQVPIGATLQAYPILRLPYGQPACTCQVYLRLYNEVEQPSGYSPQVEASTVRGRDTLIATLQANVANWRGSTRTPDLPSLIRHSLAPAVILLGHDAPRSDAPPLPLRAGDTITITLLWELSNAQAPTLLLRDQAKGWQVESSTTYPAQDGILREVRSLRVPSGTTGEAALLLTDGTVLARYSIQGTPLITERPDGYRPLQNSVFTNVGELVGYQLQGEPWSAEAPPQVTLLWQATQATEVSYTVFVQLLDASNQVVAQSDRAPADNTRPTTGWQAGEYVIDPHVLTWNDIEPVGDLRLVAGLYDALTGNRVPLASGGDAVTLIAALPSP